MITARQVLVRSGVGLVLLTAVVAACVLVGPRWYSPLDLVASERTPQVQAAWDIVVGIRLPRVLLAAMVGAALACAGAVFQAMLRNPLADPYILGISSGAGLGAIVAVLSGWQWSVLWGSPLALSAFVGALATVGVVWMIGGRLGRMNVTSLLLAGVVVNAFLSAMILFLSSVARSSQLQTTIFWLMGNLSLAGLEDWRMLGGMGAVILLGLGVLYAISPQLNVLSFDQHDAQTMGVSVVRIQAIAFGVAALITAVAVSFSGLIGFVGLIVPHAVRLLFGADHRQLLPLSAIAGAVFLILADAIARVIVAPAELPVGVVTALVGGPVFVWLLVRHSRHLGVGLDS